jgi:hypothetical protein
MLSTTNLVLIQLSGIIGLPLLLVGEAIAKERSIAGAIMCCLIGNSFLTLLALLSSKKIVEWRYSTSDHMFHILGSAGRAIMALLIGATMLFWLTIQTQAIAQGLFPDHSRLLACLIGFVLPIAMIKGITVIEQASRWTAPCMLMVICLALVTAPKGALHQVLSASYLEGIGVAIGGSILGVIDLPTFFRQAKDLASARKAIVFSFFVAVTAIECCGIFFAHIGIGVSGSLTQSQFFLFVLLSTCVANMSNLYSAAKSLESVLKITEKKAILLAGSIGVLFLQFDFLNDLEIILLAISSVLIVFGSILIFESFVPSSYQVKWIAIVVGLFTSSFELVMGVSVSQIPVVDSMVVTLMSLIVCKNRREVFCEHSNNRS